MERQGFFLLLSFFSAFVSPVVAQNLPAQTDAAIAAPGNKLFLDLGLGAAFTNPPTEDSIYGEGLAINAALILATKQNLLFSLYYTRTAFQSSRPPLSKLFGREKAPAHTINVIGVLAGKSFQLNPKYVIRLCAGPGLAAARQPYNVARASTGSSFSPNQEQYVYETRHIQNLGLSFNPVLGNNTGKWLGFNFGAFIHLNKNPALRYGSIYASLSIGKLK